MSPGGMLCYPAALLLWHSGALALWRSVGLLVEHWLQPQPFQLTCQLPSRAGTAPPVDLIHSHNKKLPPKNAQSTHLLLCLTLESQNGPLKEELAVKRLAPFEKYLAEPLSSAKQKGLA